VLSARFSRPDWLVAIAAPILLRAFLVAEIAAKICRRSEDFQRERRSLIILHKSAIYGVCPQGVCFTVRFVGAGGTVTGFTLTGAAAGLSPELLTATTE
jgi:hypothetical protein